jgi:predicted GIY-YIG superfamily endonuclease
MMFTVYVLRCRDGSLYIGQTADLKNRLERHAKGQNRWTRSRLPVTVAYREEFPTRMEAVKREKVLKTGFGRKFLKRRLARNRG